jgi:hypothetical protein
VYESEEEDDDNEIQIFNNAKILDMSESSIETPHAI